MKRFLIKLVGETAGQGNVPYFVGGPWRFLQGAKTGSQCHLERRLVVRRTRQDFHAARKNERVIGSELQNRIEDGCGSIEALALVQVVVAFHKQRDVFGEVTEKVIPFGIQPSSIHASFLKQQKALQAERCVREHLRRDVLQELAGLSPLLILLQPTDEQVPAPAVPRAGSHHLRQVI